MISMADGTTKPVETIRSGDLVMAVNALSGEAKASQVLAVHTPYRVEKFLVINGKTRMTENHPVLRNGAWTAAGEITEGDVLTGRDGRVIPVRSVDVVWEDAMVYNFQVEGQTYLADGIVVHNKEDCLLYMQYCGDCPPN
jgi:hypothetical protein